MRMWTTTSLSAILLEYLFKTAVDPSAVNLAGVLIWGLVTARSALVLHFNFSAKDRLDPLQLSITGGTWALGMVTTVASQIYLKGAFDPKTILPIIGTGFGALADCFNDETHRLRSQFAMSLFQLAFGVLTDSWSLMGKTSIDALACIWFDPLWQRLTHGVNSRLHSSVIRAKQSVLGQATKLLLVSNVGMGLVLMATTTPASCDSPPEQLSSQAIFSTNLAGPELRRIEITLFRPGFRGIMLVLLKTASGEADGLAIYVMDESEAAGLFCHIWLPGDGSKQAISDGDVSFQDAPISGEGYQAMARLAAALEDVTRDLTAEKIGFGMIRGLPETIYEEIRQLRELTGGCN